MKYTTTLVRLDSRYDAEYDDAKLYRWSSPIIYAFNYTDPSEDLFESGTNEDFYGKIGDYIKKHMIKYTDWIQHVYYDILDIIEEEDDDAPEFAIPILNNIEKYIKNSKDKNEFKFDEISKILNQHSGLEVYDFLFTNEFVNNYDISISTNSRFNNNNIKEYIVEYKTFKSLKIPSLIYEKLNDYAMTTYFVDLTFISNNYDSEIEDSDIRNCYPHIFKLPSVFSKYETEEKIGHHIKHNIQKYRYWITIITIAIKNYLNFTLYDMQEETTDEDSIKRHEYYKTNYDYIIKNHVTYDEHEGEQLIYVDLGEQDMIFFITNVIENDHFVYEMMFNIYDTNDIKYRVELINMTKNAHYATIDYQANTD